MANPKSKTLASSPSGEPFNHSERTENRENNALRRSHSHYSETGHDGNAGNNTGRESPVRRSQSLNANQNARTSSASVERAQSGVNQGAESEINHGAESGINHEAESGINHEAESEINHETESEINYRAQSGIINETQSGIDPGSQSGNNNETQSGIDPGSQSGINHETQSEISHGSQSEISHGSQSRINHVDTPVPSFSTGFRPRKSSYKLTYDPTREPGNEYQVEKVSVSDSGEDTKQNGDDDDDDVTIAGTDEVSLPVEPDDKSTQYQGDRVESAGLEEDIDVNIDEPEPVNPVSDESIPPTPVDDVDSRDPEVTSVHGAEQQEEQPNVTDVVGTKIERDLTIQSIETLRTNRTRTPKPLTPTDRGETNILFKDVPDVQRTVTRQQTESIPPPNFKSNLFNRIKRISTPTRLAKLDRFLNRTSETSKEISVRASDTQNSSKVPVASKAIASEITFVKERSRFERMSSSDSIRTLYDKRRKTSRGNSRKLRNSNSHFNKENIDNGINRPKVIEMANIKDIVSKRKTAQKHQDVSQPKNYSNAKKRAIDVASLDTTPDKATLAKRRQTGAKPITRPGLFTDRNFGKNLDVRSPRPVRSSYIDPDDIFTEDEKRANLRKAQYMNDGLKLMKRKIKNAEQDVRPRSFNAPSGRKLNIVDNDKNRPSSYIVSGEKEQRDQRKAVLSSTNIKKFAKENAKDRHIDLQSKSHYMPSTNTLPAAATTENSSKSRLPIHAKSNMNTKQNNPQKVGQTFNRDQSKQNKQNGSILTFNNTNQQTAGNNKSVEIFNKALNKHRKPSITFKEATNEEGKSRMIVQPKIHKMRNKHETRQINPLHPNRSTINPDISSQADSTHAHVANWLINSLRDDISHTTESKTYKTKSTSGYTKHSSFNTKGVSKTGHNKPRLVVKLQKRKKRMSSGSLIGLGFYKPLPKPRKRWNRLITQVGKVKGYESEIPIIHDSDEDDDYHDDQRPNTDTGKNRYPHHRRYEDEHDHYRTTFRNPAHARLGRSTAALVKFFRNGDDKHKGYAMTINKEIRTFESLLVLLSSKIDTTGGVHHIFKWPEGYEVKSLRDFKNRCVYVVSSKNTLQTNKKYGRQGMTWTNKKPSAGRSRKTDRELLNKPQALQLESQQKESPRIFSIVKNTNREVREKVILNPKTQQPFEDWLRDQSTPYMTVKHLYAMKPPHCPILSFTILFRELKHNHTFIACGDEGLNEKNKDKQKRQAPSSNSSSDSITESRNLKKKLPRQQEMGQITENYENGRPTSTALSRYDYGPRYNPFPFRGPARIIDSRRRDTVVLEVDGEIREFIPPSYFNPDDDGAKPDRLLTPDWVYGFRGRDARQNLVVLPSTGEVVYYVAAVVVLYHKDRDTQRHYIKHNEEITCMTLHPNNVLIATGQLKGKDAENGAHIRIWNGMNLSTYSVLGLGVFHGGILSIGFSQDDQGMFMCALDMSEKHILSVWEWEAEKIVARTSTSAEPVHMACFYPDGSDTSILVTYGVKHLYFWKIFFDEVRRREAKILRDRNSGMFEDDVPESVSCLAWLPNGDVVTGDSNGNLIVWERDPTDAFVCSCVIQAHSMPVMALCLLQDGTLLSGAGSELKAWDTEAEFAVSKTRQIPEAAGEIRNILPQTEGGLDGRLYIGTANSAILDGSLQSKFKYIIQGHGQGVWGVVPHPFEPTFVSAGQDQVVFKWSLVNHKLIWRSQIEAPSTCVAIDHKRELVAVGTAKGIIIFLNVYNGMHVATIEVGTDCIGCLSFSRDCQLLAMGCSDGSLTMFEMQDKGQLFRNSYVTQTNHRGAVARLDWSGDSRCIQSTDTFHELIFWNVDTMQQIEITRLVRDVDWYTATCNMAYYMIGPWSNLEKGEHIKSTSRSNTRDLMAVGDSRGRIRLFKFPCSKEKADFRSIKVYSSNVTALAFTPDTKMVLSSGGNDDALIQWSIVDEA